MSVQEVTVAELAIWMKDGKPLTIVDVRDSASYANGHIPGALSNPASGFDAGKFEDLPSDQRIVISCYRGHMSKEVAGYLASLGFTNAFSLAGGWSAWQKTPGAAVER